MAVPRPERPGAVYVRASESKSLLAREFRISRETVYSYLRAATVTG
ncbi:hypothetical protein ACIRRA_35350 [Nocardia sp. NPDC101769]